jgi:putative redox protein
MKVYYPGKKKVFIDVNGFTVKTDQGIKGGGDGEYPEPFTLFLASLGTCAGIYIKQFCDQREIDASEITIDQSLQYDNNKRMIGQIQLTVNVPKLFPEKYESALIRSAEMCAVKKHIHPDIELLTLINRLD